MSDPHDDDREPDFSDVEVELGLALPPLAPRPEVRARLMRTIAELPQLPVAGNAPTADEPTEPRRAADGPQATVTPLPVTRPHEAVTGDTDQPTGPRHGAEHVRHRQGGAHHPGDAGHHDVRHRDEGDTVVQLHRWRRAATWLGAAAAVLLVAGGVLGGWAATLNQQRVQAEQRANEQSDRRDTALAVFTAPDAVIRAGQAGSGGSVSVASSKSLNRSAVISRDLPALPADRAYALWYINGQQARPAGLFTDSSGVVYTSLQGQLDGATAIGMSVEPSSGSPAPTTTPIVVQPTTA